MPTSFPEIKNRVVDLLATWGASASHFDTLLKAGVQPMLLVG